MCIILDVQYTRDNNQIQFYVNILYIIITLSIYQIYPSKKSTRKTKTTVSRSIDIGLILSTVICLYYVCIYKYKCHICRDISNEHDNIIL